MTLTAVFFGKSEETRDAEKDLRQREDQFMALDPREGLDLGVHAHMDAQRTSVMLGRIRLVQTMNEQNSNRNLVATILSGIALVMVTKGSDIIEAVVKFL